MRWLPLAVSLLCPMVVSALEPNLLTNSSFESDSDSNGVADGWFAEVHRNEGGEGVFALDAQVKVKGKFSQRIHHISEKGWVRVSQDGIPAKPNARYLFRCWMKADCRFIIIVYAFKSDGRYDTFVIAEGKGTGNSGQKTVSKGDGWQFFSGVVRTPPDARSFKVSLITDSQGTAWFDEAELILLDRPPYTFVNTTKIAPKIDGDLSDPCWQGSEPLTPFVELGTGRIAEPSTVAKIVANSSHLFVAFFCNEPSPESMRLKTPESGEPAYMDDCVEVYLDPNHAHDGFWQFVATPKGNRWAQQVEPSNYARFWWLLPRPIQRLITGGWESAAKIGNGFWTAEIAIPFELLSFKPKEGTVIGINLCRSRKTGGEQNSAFIYFDDRTFQRPGRFPHAVFIEGQVTKDDVLRIGEVNRPHQIEAKLASLVPKPQRVVIYRKPPRPLNRPVRIMLPDKATELERTAATQLLQTLKRSGVDASISHELSTDALNFVLTTLDKLTKPVTFRLPLSKLRTFFSQRGEEAYAIFVNGGGEGNDAGRKQRIHTAVILIGSSPVGVFYGVQTLRQLVFMASEGRLIVLPTCEIWDYPDLKLRGWHFIAPLRHELPLAERFLEWMALMKFNTLVVEVDDRFPYKRHPDIAHPQSMTREQWLRFIAKARQLGFEVIPQVQTFGHFNYVLNKPAYRHLSEHKEPHPRWGFYAYCPSNPETYRLVFDLFDEVLELFRPKWFHIGHDEVTFVPIGVCERCKATGKTAWQLLAEDIQRLYSYLKAKGVERVAMWCDQLEPDRTGGYVPFFTHFAADLIPKDIVQFCWHYDARQTFPWPTRLKDKGFDVVACGWYHAQNVWRFAGESLDRRVLGYCGTTWYGLTGFVDQVDLMTAVVLGAQNSWSVENPTIDKLPHPTNVAQDLWALVGERRRWGEGVREFSAVSLSEFANAPLFQQGGFGIVPDVIAPDLMRSLVKAVWEERVPFALVANSHFPPQVVALSSDATPHEAAPDLVAIPIKTTAKALYFLMTTTARPFRTEDLYERGRSDPRKIATVIVRYADGSEERVELLFRRHLTEWNDRLGCSQARIVWQGKTKRGYLVTLCAYEWNNPKPSVPISYIVLTSAATSVQPALLALTVGRDQKFFGSTFEFAQ